MCGNAATWEDIGSPRLVCFFPPGGSTAVSTLLGSTQPVVNRPQTSCGARATSALQPKQPTKRCAWPSQCLPVRLRT